MTWIHSTKGKIVGHIDEIFADLPLAVRLVRAQFTLEKAIVCSLFTALFDLGIITDQLYLQDESPLLAKVIACLSSGLQEGSYSNLSLPFTHAATVLANKRSLASAVQTDKRLLDAIVYMIKPPPESKGNTKAL